MINNKKYTMKKIVLSLIISLPMLQSCVNGDNYAAPDLSGECTTMVATIDGNAFLGTATSTLQQYPNNVATQDDVIEAYVTSSDESGNFYKSISMVTVNGAKGFSVPIDDYNLYTQFEPGRKVYIYLKNRHFQINPDTKSIDLGSLYDNGSVATSDDEVGRLSIIDYKNIVKRGCEKVDENSIVNVMTIQQAKNDANLNKLIEINAVQFSDEFLGKKYFDVNNQIGGATNNIVKDINGQSLIVRISEFANFAGNAVASGNGKIRGVMTKYGSDYQFMVRTENDIQLTNERVVPVFQEPFTTNFPNWVKYSVTGAQVWSVNTSFGNPGSCALMSGFAGSNNTNEDWLISPAINLSSYSQAFLSFDNASRFSGNLIQVYVSTNYDGVSAPNTATWTEITGATLDTNTSSYIWTNSGLLAVNTLAGSTNARVAFKYTSTTSASRTWEIDNVKIIGL